MAHFTKSEWTEVALGGFLIALIAWLIYHSQGSTSQSGNVPTITAPEPMVFPDISNTSPYYPPETFAVPPLQVFQPLQVQTLGTAPIILLGGDGSSGDCCGCQTDGNCNSIVAAPPIRWAKYYGSDLGRLGGGVLPTE